VIVLTFKMRQLDFERIFWYCRRGGTSWQNEKRKFGISIKVAGGLAMKKFLSLGLALMISLCWLNVSLAQDQDKPKSVWVDPARYQIILLKPGNPDWPSTYNEVILLDRQEGRTWTLKSKELR
jgi:hypothetical protein